MGETRSIGEIAKINPLPPARIREDPDALASFVPMSAVSEDGRLISETARPVRELLKGYNYFEAGDLLLAKITPCFENGKAALVESLRHEFGFGSTEFHVLRPGPALVPRYLYHLVRSRFFRTSAARYMTGSAGQKRVPADFVRRYRFALPTLTEQGRIAAILDKADGIRRKREESMRLADQLLRSTFLEMFGDPITNPKGWPSCELGEIGAVQGGLQVTSTRASNEIDVPYLRVANVYRDRLELSEVKHIRVSADEMRRASLNRGDILLVEGHGNPKEIGRSAVWTGQIDPCVHQNHLIRVRLDAQRAEPAYVSAFLNSAGGRRQLFRLGKTTSGLNTISTSNVKGLHLPLPPLDHQERYLEVASRVGYLARRLLDEQLAVERLFASVSAAAFE